VKNRFEFILETLEKVGCSKGPMQIAKVLDYLKSDKRVGVDGIRKFDPGWP
jgi:hypothetical protein